MEISRAQFRSAKKAWSTIVNVLRVESNADYLLSSYEELEQECLRLALKSATRREYDWLGFVNDTHVIDRRIFNLLASARAYIDKSRSIVKKVGGEVLLEELDNLRNHQHQTYFSYRLLEMLRNHSQHAGTATDSVARYSGMEEVPTASTAYAEVRFVFVTRPKLNADAIAENKRISLSMRREIASEVAPDGTLDLLPHIRQYVACLGTIHEGLRTYCLDEFEKAWSEIKALIDAYKKEHGDDTLGLYALALGDGVIASDRIPLFSGPSDRVRYLSGRNVHMSKIHKWIVSSELPTRERK